MWLKGILVHNGTTESDFLISSHIEIPFLQQFALHSGVFWRRLVWRQRLLFILKRFIKFESVNIQIMLSIDRHWVWSDLICFVWIVLNNKLMKEMSFNNNTNNRRKSQFNESFYMKMELFILILHPLCYLNFWNTQTCKMYIGGTFKKLFLKHVWTGHYGY